MGHRDFRVGGTNRPTLAYTPSRRLAWRLVCILLLAIGSFGTPAAAQLNSGNQDNAELVSHTMPNVIECDTTKSVAITVRNTGDTTWQRGYALTALENPEPFGANASYALPDTARVAPGESFTFAIELTAPATVNRYTTRWQMSKESEAFGAVVEMDIYSACQTGETDAAELVFHTLPETMACGAIQTVEVTLRNTGTSVWRPEHWYRLAAVGGSDPLRVARRVVLPMGLEIFPGESHTFSFDLTAPAQPGSYLTDWRMVHEVVRWFGAKAEQTVAVECSDFGVAVEAPRLETLAHTETFNWGMAHEAALPAAFAFKVTGPEGGSFNDLRIVSSEGPLSLTLAAAAGWQPLSGGALAVDGTLEMAPGVILDTLPLESAFRFVLAFDHSQGGTFQFEVAGTFRKKSAADPENIILGWVGFNGTFDEEIPTEELPQALTFTARLDNNDPTGTVEVVRDQIELEFTQTPFGVDVDIEAFGPPLIELPPGDSYSFDVVVFVGPFAETGDLSAQLGVLVEIDDQTDALPILPINGHIEIMGLDIFLDRITVVSGTGDIVGHLGSFNIDPVAEDRPLTFTIENANLSTVSVGAIFVDIFGPAGLGIEYIPEQPTADVPANGGLEIPGDIRVLATAVPGDFTLRVRFRLTEIITFPSFDEEFVFDILGSLTACNSAPCGPLIQVQDDRGLIIRGPYSRRPTAGTIQELGFEIFNLGDQDLEIQSLSVNGDARFSISAQPNPTIVAADSGMSSAFKIAFDATNVDISQTYQANVEVNSNSVTNAPFQFTIRVEPQPNLPMQVEVIGFSVVENHVDLGRSARLPLEPVLKITNLSDGFLDLNNFKALKSRGGPLDWSWQDPQPPEGADTTNAIRVGEGSFYTLGGVIHIAMEAGDVNKPYTFNISFDYRESSQAAFKTYDLVVTGTLQDIWNSTGPAPDPKCNDPEEQNDCDRAYCAALEQIAGQGAADLVSCLGSSTVTFFGCTGCTATLPAVPISAACYATCLGAITSSVYTCRDGAADWIEGLAVALDNYQRCYCNTFNQFCPESFFVGYDVLNLPVGSAVDLTARCFLPSGPAITTTETIRLSNDFDFELLSCPVGAGVNVSTLDVVGGGNEPFPCRLANPQPGDDPGIPQYSRTLDGHFSGVFDCGCATPEDCADLYTLTGTASGLQVFGDEIIVVVNVEGDFLPFAVTTTVTENGHFSFPVGVPESSSYSVAIDNKLDYPHCDVETTGNPISGPGGVVDVVRLICDESRPNVRIIDPLDGDTVVPGATGTITVLATAGDAAGVEDVTFYDDGQVIAVDRIPPYQVAWQPGLTGTRRLEAAARNIHNIVTFSNPVSVTVSDTICDLDISPPIIESFLPEAGETVHRQVSSYINLEAIVTDLIGMSHVDFFLDGQKVTKFGAGPLYSFAVLGIDLGNHTLRIRAVDSCGKSTAVPPGENETFSFTVVEGDPTLATGGLLVADCNTIYGWADDSNHTSPILVELYHGGPRGSGTLFAQVIANQNCGGGISNCFTLTTPAALQTGTDEVVYAHARDVDADGVPTGQWPLLALSPRTLTCGGGGGGGGGGILLPPNGLNASQGAFTDRVQVSWSAAPDATSYQVFRSETATVGSAAMIEGSVTATQVDDMSVTAGTTYHYWLKSVNAQGASAYSDAASGFAQGTPTNTAGPDGFVDVANCGGIAGWARDLDFTGPVEVHLYKNAPAGSGTLIATVLADDLRADLPFPDQNHGFGWTVPAGSIPDTTPIYVHGIGVDSLGAANGENVALSPSPRFFDCAATAPPPAPTGVSASDGTHTGFVRITWSPVGGNPTYQVWRSNTSSTGGAEPVSLAQTETSFDDTSASPGQTYFYFVKASNAQGASPFSAGNSGYADGSSGGGGPPAGSLDQAVCGEVSGWARDPDTTAPIEVRIYRGGPPGSGALIVTKLANLLRSDLPFPDQSHGFFYQPSPSTINDTQPVHAYAVDVDAQGNPTGDIVQLAGSPRPFDCPSTGPPPAPEGVQATNGSHVGFVRITWVPGPNNPTYQVWRSTTDNSANAEPVSLMMSGTTTYDDDSAVSGQTYYYFVKASNSFGASPFSNSDAGWAQ